MRWISLSLAVLAACETAASDPVPPPKAPPSAPAPPAAPAAPTVSVGHTPKELIDHKADFLDQILDVDIYESMLDDQHSSIAPPGGYTVDVKDVGAHRFTVLRGLPKHLAGPMRVHGKLGEGRLGLELSVISFSSLKPPPPIAIAHAQDLVAEPRRYAGKVIEVTDTYMSGFEASYLGDPTRGPGRVWLDGDANIEIHCAPPPSKTPYDYTPHQVHVIGTAYTSGQQYGHLGGSQALVVARLIEYLPCDPKATKAPARSPATK